MPTFSVPVAAPPRQVFDYLADPRHRPQWQWSLRAVRLVDAGPPHVGMRWVDQTAVGAGPHMEITEMTPPGPDGEPGSWSEVGTWHGLRAELALTFEQVPHHPRRTVVRASADIGGSLVWLPVRAVLQALAPAAIRSDLRR